MYIKEIDNSLLYFPIRLWKEFKMASKMLPKTEQNFIRFVKICQDVLKLPLVDILASEIQPVDLYIKISRSCVLLTGKNKLCPKQQKICFCLPPSIPNYNEFDVTLLYKLIRELCPSVKPTKGWGKKPFDTDTLIGDDIERLISCRNNLYEGSSEISDSDFQSTLKMLKSVFQRIQMYMTRRGYNVNYEEKMANIIQLDLGNKTIGKYKIAYLLEYTIDRWNQTNEKGMLYISPTMCVTEYLDVYMYRYIQHYLVRIFLVLECFVL